MPYRESRVEAPRLEPEPGIVDDMVRQFADRHAFLRELVQNGIDAGATCIIVTLHRAADGGVATSVEDDGKGMSRSIIEGPLLTLFQSSKENDTTKIGKYGVGFMSVFAINPTEVEVRTRTGAEAWQITLLRDYSYELAVDASPNDGTGTIVTIRGAMTTEEWTEHVASAQRALRRWCRHARLPIRLEVIDESDPTHGLTREVNEPLALDTTVSVSFKADAETWVVGVGERAGSGEVRSFAGFYNRGLTLFESESVDDEYAGLHFKIDSPRLSHTLSRDNIRRDSEYRRAMARVSHIADGELWNALAERTRTAAASGDATALASLLAAAAAKTFHEKRGDALEVPLTDAVGGRLATTIREAIRHDLILVSDASTPLTRELARRGHPVVRPVALGPYVALHAGNIVHEAHEVFGVCDASGVALSKVDLELAAEIARLLRAAGRTLERVSFAAFGGVWRDDRCRVLETDHVAAASRRSDRSWSRGSTVFLNVESVLVGSARKRATSNVGLAAHVVARAVLLDEGPIGRSEVERLLEAVRA
jgi:Histidine kinase-, DNA gyrase B-, and HSP90-like ATPase